MGQAKYNRERNERERVILATLPLPRVASAIQKLTEAASGALGADCVVNSNLARLILQRLGAEARMVVGQAAWRVGPGDGDVIAHVLGTPALNEGPNALPFHCWLEYADHIIDFSTFQLPLKAAQMDALDGQTTTVTWSPTFLCVPRSEVSPYPVVQRCSAGLFYYAADRALHDQVMASFKSDAEDEALAWIIYNSAENLQVFGPNHFNDQDV